MNDKELTRTEEVLASWQIPECCKNAGEKNWKPCKHVAQSQKPYKRNIGL